MLKILVVFGTRPEAIKMAPVIKELCRHGDDIVCRVCVTGQHRQMLDSILKLFEIAPDYDLDIMQQNQTLEYITTTVLSSVSKIIRQENPDFLMVQGDTTTAMAASLAGFYQKIRVCHVEAGLRTWDICNPFPEESNRRIIDSVSSLFFAHTERAKQNLLQEGITKTSIEVTGNTVIDALLDVANRDFGLTGTILANIPFNQRKIILLTAHRRENFGQPLVNICNAIKEIALRHSSDVFIVYPVHLNPNVQEPARSILGNIDNVLLTEPLEYVPFIHLMKRAYLVLTDSGGLQEEAPSLGKPVLVLREVTERPEAVEAGTAEIVGTQSDKIIQRTCELLQDEEQYLRMAKAVNPFGDGRASQRIVARLLKEKR